MTAPRHATGPASTSAPPYRDSPARWVVGLSLFAGIMMIITGVFNAIEGLVALFRNEVYLATTHYVFAFDLTTWGWFQLVLGIIVIAAGFGVVSGRIWGRVVGITIALLTMLANFAFMYPVLTAEVLPYDFWRQRMWFSSWI